MTWQLHAGGLPQETDILVHQTHALAHNSPKLEAMQMLTALDQVHNGDATIRWSRAWPWTGVLS